jgi:hypothetical protein
MAGIRIRDVSDDKTKTDAPKAFVISFAEKNKALVNPDEIKPILSVENDDGKGALREAHVIRLGIRPSVLHPFAQIEGDDNYKRVVVKQTASRCIRADENVLKEQPLLLLFDADKDVVDTASVNMFARYCVGKNLDIKLAADLAKIWPRKDDHMIVEDAKTLKEYGYKQYVTLRMARLLGKMVSSGFVVDKGMALCVEAGLFNHSCDPNCDWYLDERTQFVVYAIKDVQPGEELTIDYVGDRDEYKKASAEQKREMFKERMGFECHCVQCKHL